MSQTSEEKRKSRMRWVTLGEAIAIAALIVSGLGLYREWKKPDEKTTVVEKCRAHIADAVSKGARLLTGSIPGPEAGNFVAPALLVDVRHDMLITSEETFGPVAPVLRFVDEDDVRTAANASEMGLAAYVYTRDLKRAMRLSDALEYGMVGINTASFTGAPIPFGGWKQSGLGREGSRHGLQEFMELKYVCFGGLAAPCCASAGLETVESASAAEPATISRREMSVIGVPWSKACLFVLTRFHRR